MSSFNYPKIEGGGGGSATINSYPTRNDFPLTAAEGEVAVALDTATIYTYSSAAGGWSGQKAYNPRPVITLNAGNIANKYVDLGVIPSIPNLTRMSIVTGGVQNYGLDFSISGSLLTWNGLSLDGVLEVGDQIIVDLIR